MKYKNFLEEIGFLGITYKTIKDDKKIGISSYNRILQFSYKDNYLGTEFMSFTGDAEDSFKRIFEEYSKVISSQEIDLCLLSQELFTPIYTLQEYIDDLNEKEKLITPTKNIDNYFVIDHEIYTKEELLQIKEKHILDLVD